MKVVASFTVCSLGTSSLVLSCYYHSQFDFRPTLPFNWAGCSRLDQQLAPLPFSLLETILPPTPFLLYLSCSGEKVKLEMEVLLDNDYHCSTGTPKQDVMDILVTI